MKTTRGFSVLFLLTLAAALILLSGCGGVSASSRPGPSPTPNPSPTPVGSPSPTPTPTPSATGTFIYGITVFESSSGYLGGQINPTTGQVTPLGPGFNDSGLGQNIVTQVLTDPQGRFLYSLNLGAFAGGQPLGQPGIGEMQINRQTGALSRIPGGPLVFTQSQQGMLAIDHTGRFLFEPNSSNTFDIYSINQSTGALTKASSSMAASIGPFTTITTDGHFLIDMGSNLIETLSVDASGNLAIAQPPIVTGGSTIGVVGQVAVSNDNQFLYVLNQGNIAIFQMNSAGMLAPVTGSPFATDPGGSSFSLAPDGRHLYVDFQNNGANTVKGFTFDPMAKTFTPIAGALITDNAVSVVVDPSGRFAYVTENGHLSTYAVNPATGALTLSSQGPQPVSESSTSIVVVP